jgi:hypothetical protein
VPATTPEPNKSHDSFSQRPSGRQIAAAALSLARNGNDAGYSQDFDKCFVRSEQLGGHRSRCFVIEQKRPFLIHQKTCVIGD